MPVSTPLPRHDDDDVQARSEEGRMRLALEKLGTRSTPPVRSRHGAATGTSHSVPQRRNRFVREGDVPVERVAPPVRSPGGLQRELTEERAARQRAEQALSDAQARVAVVQAALAQSEQATRVAREAVEEREAAMAGLRTELQRTAVELEAALANTPAQPLKAKARRGATTQARVRQIQAVLLVADPQPFKWWLPLTQPRS